MPTPDVVDDQRCRLMVEAVRDYAIYMLDLEGRVVTSNVGAQRNKGYISKGILGKHFSKFFRPEDAQSPANEMLRLDRQ